MEGLLTKAEKLHKELGTNWRQTLKKLKESTREVSREEEKKTSTGKRAYTRSGKYTKYAMLKRKKFRKNSEKSPQKQKHI